MTLATIVKASDVDPGADFSGYMEDLKKQEEEAERARNLYNEHEIWRQTTWSGYAVRQMQKVGGHFAPFFEALADLVEGSAADETPGTILFTLLIRVLVISSYIAAAYAIARILNSIFGRDIVIEEEIIIEEDEEDEANEEKDGKKDK
ncbi:hypothetical protein ACA910_001626 [Epithemia clementina (nom. ined.)]